MYIYVCVCVKDRILLYNINYTCWPIKCYKSNYKVWGKKSKLLDKIVNFVT